MKIQCFNGSEVDHCAYYKRNDDGSFVILMLCVDDMLVAIPNMKKIIDLKAQLSMTFEMKDLQVANKIIGMRIHRDKIGRKIWLSQKSYMQKDSTMLQYER